jgi:DNA-binding MarR family transcriptional regulator
VLLSAATAEHTRPSDLVPVVALSPSGITQLLDRIEDAGLVVRDAGLTGDRREIRIGLTPAGERSLAVRLERLTARAGAVATFLDVLLVPLLEE